MAEMALTAGTRLRTCEIVAPLGAGGMAQFSTATRAAALLAPCVRRTK